LAGKSLRKRSPERPEKRWQDNVETNGSEIARQTQRWVHFMACDAHAQKQPHAKIWHAKLFYLRMYTITFRYNKFYVFLLTAQHVSASLGHLQEYFFTNVTYKNTNFNVNMFDPQIESDGTVRMLSIQNTRSMSLTLVSISRKLQNTFSSFTTTSTDCSVYNLHHLPQNL
jgi:hypothetical protein